jgi:hypothetical protein
MRVPVMNVWKMLVRVNHSFVSVLVTVRIFSFFTDRVLMLMMRIVHMTMRVRDELVDVIVSVPLGKMQPQTKSHECARDKEWHCHSLAPHCEADRRADERSKREVRSRPRRSQLAHGKDVEHQAQSITEKPDGQCASQISEPWRARACS